jgi:V/A-type H+-transporting ATPase subunit F
MNEEKKKTIGVIGSQEFTIGFRLAGIQKVFDNENFEEKLEELIEREDLGILVVEQSDLDSASKRVQRKVEGSADPVVVPLSEDAESERLQEKIKRAIGADITG